MNSNDTNWKAFLLRALVLGLVIFVAVRTAVARDGVPGGTSRSFLTIAGTVTGVTTGMTTMRFTFRHREPGDGGVPEVACERTVLTPVAASGEFVAEVPREPFTPECPESMFDGRDVYVDVSIGGVTVVERSPVNQVPYAVHADTAAAAVAAAPDSGLDRRLIAASTVDPGRVILNGSTPQDAGLSITGDATVGGTISGHGADMLAFGAACLATGRGGRFVVEGTVANAATTCAAICASRSPGAGCVPSCVVGWTIAPNGDHYGYNDNECNQAGGVGAGYHRVCCCTMGCFAPVQVP